MSQWKCSWCHSIVDGPCATVRECKMCPEPYTLTAEQAAKFQEAVATREPRRAKPLPTVE